MAFKDLKGNKNLFAKLKDKIENDDKKDYSDVRYWSPEVDKSGNGFAIVRFLPASEGEDMPFVKLYRHQFKVGARWLVENCPTTIGLECPVCKANSELWATEIPMNQDIVRKRKRGLGYIANILVISDSKHPENEGKVFLYKFGAKIFAKIKAAIDPEFEDETPFNPFSFWEGANFKIKIRNVENYRNYDNSGFDSPSPLFNGDDAALEALWKTQHSLAVEVAPEKFKSFVDIEKIYEKVVGAGRPPARSTEDDDVPASVTEETPKATKPAKTKPSAPAEGDEDMDFYSKLLEED